MFRTKRRSVNPPSPQNGSHRRLAVGRRLGVGLLALSLAVSACTDASDTEGSVDESGSDQDGATTDLSSDDTELTSALTTVDSCDALLDRLIAEGLEQVGPYGFDNGLVLFGEVEEAMAEDAMEAETSTADFGDAQTTAAGAATNDDGVSGTNNQEAGVDEADLVKTDGKRMVVVAGSRVQILDVTGGTPALTGTVDLPDELGGGELFLVGDKAILMTSGWSPVPFATEISDDVFGDIGVPTGQIVEIDLNEAAVTQTLEFEGSYLSAREIDGTIRVVVRTEASRFPFIFPSGPNATETALEANRKVISESTIDNWLPSYRLIEGAPSTDGAGGESLETSQLMACDRVHLPEQFAGFGTVSVLTIDAASDLTIGDSLGVVTDGQTVYASTDRLTVATPRWPSFDDEGNAIEDDSYRTAVHNFDISDPTVASYVASGTVPGHLLDQYSLSEKDGFLRVATTDHNTRWGWGQADDSESFVTILAEEDKALKQVGQVDGLGIGERIFAVRYIGDIGYVVTFEQIDPLYAIDLSDPTDPQVLSELKIEGFSSYLHPIDDNTLLGIGTDGDEEGNTFGTVASLFDISDPTDVTRVEKLLLGPSIDRNQEQTWVDSNSRVASDAKAFTFWEGKAIIPISWWANRSEGNQYIDANGAVAVVVEVDAESGSLTPVGQIGHPTRAQCEGPSGPRILESTDEVVVREGGLDSITSFDELIELSTVVQPFIEEPASAGDEPAIAEPASAGEEAAIEEPAAISPVEPNEEYCWRTQAQISRSIVIGEALFTVSDAGVAVNDFDSLESITWISFPTE